MNNDLRLGIDSMDEKHDEFLALLSQIQSSSADKFLSLFEEMIEHTKAHFSYEESIMNEHSFYGKGEHFEEHSNLLGEMQYFYDKAKKTPSFGKSYINNYACEKFQRHIINIDSQLAMFLKERDISL